MGRGGELVSLVLHSSQEAGMRVGGLAYGRRAVEAIARFARISSRRKVTTSGHVSKECMRALHSCSCIAFQASGTEFRASCGYEENILKYSSMSPSIKEILLTIFDHYV